MQQLQVLCNVNKHLTTCDTDDLLCPLTAQNPDCQTPILPVFYIKVGQSGWHHWKLSQYNGRQNWNFMNRAQCSFVALRSSMFFCRFTQLFWWSNTYTCMTLSWIFDAPGSNDGGYCFCPVCFSVCLLVRLLSTLTFALTFESLEKRALYMAYILRQQWRSSAIKGGGAHTFFPEKWKAKQKGSQNLHSKLCTMRKTCVLKNSC